MPKVRVGDSELRYQINGSSGDPVVFVHGSLVDHHSFDALVGPLAQNLVVMSYDRRGHGESTGPRRESPVRDDASDLAGLLEAVDLYPVHLVAHSYAGAVAFRLAHDRPEMVRSIAVHESVFVGLLLEDPVNAAEAERVLSEMHRLQGLVSAGEREKAARGITEAFSLQPGAWERLAPPARATLVRHVDRWCEEFDDPNAIRPNARELSESLVPVLLTVGELSPPFLHRITAALAQSLQNATVCTLADAGHVPHLTQPHQYAGVLVNFLLERNVPTT